MDEQTYQGVELDITPETQADIDALIAGRADLSDDELELHLIELLTTKDGDRPRPGGPRMYYAYCAYHGPLGDVASAAAQQRLIKEHLDSTPGPHAIRTFIDEV